MRAEKAVGSLGLINPRLWMLISPALPVGGYSYSQGLEQAVACGWVNGRDEAEDWIQSVAAIVLPSIDLPYLKRLHDAARAGDGAGMARWNDELLACRETSELRAEDAAMGEALDRLLRQLPLPEVASMPRCPPIAFATSFAVACVGFAIPVEVACAALAWVWFENQVAAAVKLVPLGQTEGQQILMHAGEGLENLVQEALGRSDGDLGATLPGLAIASAAHETKYSRLFRS